MMYGYKYWYGYNIGTGIGKQYLKKKKKIRAPYVGDTYIHNLLNIFDFYFIYIVKHLSLYC